MAGEAETEAVVAGAVVEMLDGHIIADTSPVPGHVAGLASIGLRTRKLRAVLSALGNGLWLGAKLRVQGVHRGT